MTFRVRIDGRLLRVRQHAVLRYQERVRPALSESELQIELERVLPGATLVYDRPSWCAPASSDGKWPDSWVVLTDAIVFPVIDGFLITCLTRGEVGSKVRVERQDLRRERQDRKLAPGAKKKHGKVARDARRRSRAAREAEMTRSRDD